MSEAQNTKVVHDAYAAFDADFVMVFTLRDGKIVAFREFTDSAAVNAAFA